MHPNTLDYPVGECPIFGVTDRAWLVGVAREDTVFEGDREGVQCRLPAHRPAGPAASAGIEGSGHQVQAFEGGLLGREVPANP